MNHRPLSWPLACLGVVLLGATLQAQVVPHPYLTLERGERITNWMIGDGMVRRAATYLRELQTQLVRSSSDAIVMREAEVYRASGQRTLVDRTLSPFTLNRPNAPEVAFAHAERGFTALEEGQYDAAAAYLGIAAQHAHREFLTRNDTVYKSLEHAALFWKGASQCNKGLFEEAIESFTQCASVDSAGPYAGRAIFAMGQMYERNGSTQDAADAYARIRARYPRGSVILAARIREAQMYLQRRMPERGMDVLAGIEDLLDAAQRKDSSVLAPQILADDAPEQVHVLRMVALLQRSRYSAALDTALAFLNSYPSSEYRSMVRLHAGYAALHVDSNQLALRELDHVLAEVANDASPIRQQALLYRALALRRCGKADAAGAAFADLSARSDYPYQAQALVEVGQGAYQRGDLEGARKALERAERSSLDPSTTIRARLLLGAVHVEKQRWTEAAAVYERAEQLARTASEEFLPYRERYLAESRLKRGICLAQDNKREAAIKALTEYLGNHPLDEQRDEGTFWLAEMMYRSDLLRNAQELYEEVVNRYTASMRREEAMYGLAWTHFRRREFDKSVAEFGRMLQSYPKSQYAVDALVRRGDGLYITRRYSEAARQYEEAARRSPNSEEGLYAGFQVGQSLYRAGNLAEASTRLRAYVAAHSTSRLADDALYLAGWVAFQQRDDATAIAEFQRLLDAYPDGDQAVRALYTMADAKYNLGDAEGAKEAYRQLMNRYPTHPLAVEAGKGLQMVLVGEGRTDEAIALADQLISADPNSAVAREFAWEKANIFYTGRNYRSAAEELQAYMSRFPDGDRSDDALYMLGKSYLTMEELQQANDAFARLQKQFPHSDLVPASHMDLADYHRDAARADVADSLYAIVQRSYPNDTAEASRAGFERATLARIKGDTLRAVALYRVVADAYAGTEYGDQARYQLSLYYRGIRQPDSARNELAILIRTSHSPMVKANALYDMGDTYARAKLWDDAIMYLERVRTEYSGFEDWFTLSLIGLGACYEQKEEYEKAKQAYAVVAELRPEDDYGKTAIARLKRLEKKR